ncbi:hypothetical protein BC828DRAFT_408974 [Blastocladiella britannica]|nr:hypothetical protein BC828DRAFT_408974 [Blastocladiella britannica]
MLRTLFPAARSLLTAAPAATCRFAAGARITLPATSVLAIRALTTPAASNVEIAPPKPSRPPSAYMLFTKAYYEQYNKDKLAGKPVMSSKDAMIDLAKQWKSNADGVQEKYAGPAAELKAQFAAAKLHWETTYSVVQRERRVHYEMSLTNAQMTNQLAAQAHRDARGGSAGKIKRLPNKYTLFFKHYCSTKKGQGAAALSAEASAVWKAMSEDEKNVWKRKAQEQILYGTTDE